MKMNNARLTALVVSAAIASVANANLTPYTQNFESLNAANGGALSADGWKIFGNVFTPSGGYIYGYGVFGAPNGGPGFSSIASGEGGANQGSQYINIYSDYNNGDHANGNKIEANVFQEQVIGAADLGLTYKFAFDYKASSMFGPSGATKTFAFFKVLNPNTGFTMVANPTFETTMASGSTWSEGNSLSIAIDNSWAGHILQFGFVSTATNYEGSGVYYDNLSFGAVPEPATMTVLGLSCAALLRRRRTK